MALDELSADGPHPTQPTRGAAPIIETGNGSTPVLRDGQRVGVWECHQSHYCVDPSASLGWGLMFLPKMPGQCRAGRLERIPAATAGDGFVQPVNAKTEYGQLLIAVVLRDVAYHHALLPKSRLCARETVPRSSMSSENVQGEDPIFLTLEGLRAELSPCT